MIYHSDRGSRYACDAYREGLKAYGIDRRMSRKADCSENVAVESFYATIKEELVYERVWSSFKEVRLAVTDYIEAFYNRQRLHSYLVYTSPADYEKKQTFKKVAQLTCPLFLKQFHSPLSHPLPQPISRTS